MYALYAGVCVPAAAGGCCPPAIELHTANTPQEGKVSSRSKLTYKGHLEPGIELVIGTHEVELDACITMEEFTSGSCFMTDGAASATGTTTAAYTPMRSVAGFKKVRPAGDGTSKVGPAPLARPLHSLDDPEALVLNQPQLVRWWCAWAVWWDYGVCMGHCDCMW